MSRSIDVGAHRTLCAAIAASDFEVSDRIKSILQVTHELLGTSSIIAYAYNTSTDGLEIVAMPGVAKRELMRGPTDKLIFWWESPDSTAAHEGVWTADDTEHAAYLDKLEQLALERSSTPRPRKLARSGDFRNREKGEYNLAMAKIYLWKGKGQTNDKVGQLFFNFRWKEGEEVFSDDVRRSIHFVAKLVRELLISHYYHRAVPRALSTPEHLLRKLGAAFSDWAEADSSQGLEQSFARTICDASLEVTGNFGGQADFVFLIGERLGRRFIGGAVPQGPDEFLYHDESITSTCIRQEKYFIGNDVRSKDWKHLEFEPGLCRSLMVVPVMLEDSVRAVIHLTSPRIGAFLDPQARAMQDIEHHARFAILRLDERRQKKQMTAALDFYTGRGNLSREGAAGLMRAVLSALGAKWGTYWPIEGYDGDTPIIRRGIKFFAEGTESVAPEDQKVGIRTTKDDVGLTQILVGLNRGGGDSTFFALHVLGDSKDRPGEDSSNYYLQVFSGQTPGGTPGERLEPENYTDRDAIRNAGPIRLNPNTTMEQHTRVAFVVRGEKLPLALVWLGFHKLHEFAWWERRYINGLASSLGKLLRISSLELAVRDFWHRLPNLAFDAAALADKVKKEAKAPVETCDSLVDRKMQTIFEDVERIETKMLTILWKTAEVKTLLGEGKTDDPDKIFGTRSIKDYIKMAIDAVLQPGSDRAPWKEACYSGIEPEQSIGGVFYTVLFNILSNVIRHGWAGLDEEAMERQFVAIWVRHTDGDKCVTYVGNTGHEIAVDPIREGTPGEESGDDKIGLRVAKDLLRRNGGDIRLVNGQLRDNLSHCGAPQDLMNCQTIEVRP